MLSVLTVLIRTKWLEAIKDIGDIATQYDTTAASLPWAAVRLLLTVGEFNVIV